MARLQVASTFHMGTMAFPRGGTSNVWKVIQVKCLKEKCRR